MHSREENIPPDVSGLKSKCAGKVLLGLLKFSGKLLGMAERPNRHRIVGIAGHCHGTFFNGFLVQAHMTINDARPKRRLMAARIQTQGLVESPDSGAMLESLCWGPYHASAGAKCIYIGWYHR